VPDSEAEIGAFGISVPLASRTDAPESGSRAAKSPRVPLERNQVAVVVSARSRDAAGDPVFEGRTEHDRNVEVHDGVEVLVAAEVEQHVRAVSNRER
jgi:hypothetical protein